MRGIISDPSLYNLGQIIAWCCAALLFLFLLLINASDYFPLRNKLSEKKEKRQTRIEPESELELGLEKHAVANRKNSQPESLPTAKESLQTISFNDIEITNALTLRINNQEVIREPTVYTCCLEKGLNYLIMDFQTKKTVNRLIFFDTFLNDSTKENLHLFLRKLSATFPSNPLTKEDSCEAYLRIERIIKIQKSQKAIETLLRDTSVLMSFDSALEIRAILKKLRETVSEYCMDILEGSYYATFYSIDVNFLLSHQALQAINNKHKFTEVECVFATRVNAYWMPTVWKVVAGTRTYCLMTFTPEEFKALSAEVESEITVLKFNAKRMEDNWVKQGEAIAKTHSFITLNEEANLEFHKYLLTSEDIECFNQWYKQVLIRYIAAIAKDIENQYLASMTITY